MAFNPGGGGGGGIAAASDVILSSPSTGQVLGYDGPAVKWKNLPQPSRLVESVNTVNAAGSAVTIPDVTVATINVLKLSAANCSITLPTPTAGESLLIVLTQDGTGSRTASWSGVWWQSATTPTLTTTPNKSDVFSFISVDGAKWLGFQVGQNF